MFIDQPLETILAVGDTDDLVVSQASVITAIDIDTDIDKDQDHIGDIVAVQAPITRLVTKKPESRVHMVTL